MADDGDRGRVLSELHLKESLARLKANKNTGESSIYCEACGEPIPEGRREAAKGCTRCAKCQAECEEYERRMI